MSSSSSRFTNKLFPLSYSCNKMYPKKLMHRIYFLVLVIICKGSLINLHAFAVSLIQQNVTYYMTLDHLSLLYSCASSHPLPPAAGVRDWKNFSRISCYLKKQCDFSEWKTSLKGGTVIDNVRLFLWPLILWSLYNGIFFLQHAWAPSQSYEKVLLASSGMSVRLSLCQSAWNSSDPTRRIFIKYSRVVL